MKIGIDTTFLIQVELLEHPGHRKAGQFLDQTLSRGDTFVVTGQLFQEFLHIATDPSRFVSPLSMVKALAIADDWWNAREVIPVYPNQQSQELFSAWMGSYNLGRKRILDTMLAAVYCANGAGTIVTSNARDFELFQELQVLVP